jgi:hypothetical protein
MAGGVLQEGIALALVEIGKRGPRVWPIGLERPRGSLPPTARKLRRPA